MREFGELLRTYRIRVGLTQQQLADFAMVSVRAIRDLECGRTRSPRAETIRLLADGLRLDDDSRATLREAGGRPVGPVSVPPPAPSSAIMGRELETAALGDLFADGRRLVTITGVSGVGKTRLALEVVGELHFRLGWSVVWLPVSRTPAIDDDQDTVLVTDHVPDTRLLGSHPRLRIIVTALAPTGTPGERVFPLAPLADDAAVRLLVTNVRRVRPAFRQEPANHAALIGLVHELDGLPSALEFAAGWFMVYSPQHLLERLRSNPLDPTSAHLRDSLRLSLSTLDLEDRVALVRLADRGEWDDEDAVRALSVRGLVRRAGPRYEVLNLVRAAVLEPVSGPHLTGGVALTWPC
ncbi:helix-turn-helix domain-containing protein [Lentzea nigeriaca]|uniref:helix-turn-helix domain-containing protein n=1 Tax=Lentzea nigeriaca TaxID=1128665 RepID=UPI00195C67AB|nr:helix-turn-helix domain-containing protein [Lentzea nigeriaca]MBM7856733.1 transcriptional regulator with XRE-family HTH domain [Lentzea nigeriaca]